jgi:hypothetical protein
VTSATGGLVGLLGPDRVVHGEATREAYARDARQMQNAVRKAGLRTRVVHLAELVAGGRTDRSALH